MSRGADAAVYGSVQVVAAGFDERAAFAGVRAERVARTRVARVSDAGGTGGVCMSVGLSSVFYGLSFLVFFWYYLRYE